MLKIGGLIIRPLNGGITHMDGGAMFGVVPKPLWTRKYEVNDNNQVPLLCYPILVQTNDLNILIDSGVGNDKLSDKERRNYGVTYESDLSNELSRLNLATSDIDYVLMTHMHFDHALGLTTAKGQSVFENAVIVTSSVEWEEMQQPNIRSKSTYWARNYKGIEHQIKTFDKEINITNEIKLIHTGGHSNGHSIILFESNGVKAAHLGDILPTAANFNPLWVTAYDDYPMTSIKEKEKWLKELINCWIMFYHDANYFAVQYDGEGITKMIPRGNK